MQSLAVPTEHNPSGRTPEEILAALRGSGGTRRWSFRYDLLTAAGVLVGPMANVLHCKITQNWLADIKRQATFRLWDSGGIDYLSDRIRPWVRLHLAPYGANDWVEWPQGVFLLSSPKRVVDESGIVVREVEAYDQIQVYADDVVPTRYTVITAEQYMTAILALLGITPPGYPPPAYPPLVRPVPVDREWPPGTSKLRIINDLLDAINHESLSFDEMGGAVIRAYISPSERAAEYTYADDEHGLMLPALEQSLDLFSIANSWKLVVSSPDRPTISSTYTNTNPASPTSTVRRGRTIMDYRTDQEAADQTDLDAKVRRLAFEASQVYEAIEFQTGIMPIHSGNDVYQMVHSGLAVNAKYAEQSWEMELQAGVPMKHRARRVVSI